MRAARLHGYSSTMPALCGALFIRVTATTGYFDQVMAAVRGSFPGVYTLQDTAQASSQRSCRGAVKGPTGEIGPPCQSFTFAGSPQVAPPAQFTNGSTVFLSVSATQSQCRIDRVHHRATASAFGCGGRHGPGRTFENGRCRVFDSQIESNSSVEALHRSAWSALTS